MNFICIYCIKSLFYKIGGIEILGDAYYDDGTGAIHEGSTYPTVALDTETCVTSTTVLPVTDYLEYTSNLDAGLTAQGINILGQPSIGPFAGQEMGSMSLSVSDVFDYFLVDEGQDFSPKVIGFLNKVAKNLVFVGDANQSFYQEHEDDLPIYLELKGRQIERTFKQRIAIKKEHLPLLTDPQRHYEFLDYFPGNWLAERFVFESHRKRLKPLLLVDYIRRPYTSEFDLNFRITFDDRLNAVAVDQLFVGQEQSWKHQLPGYTILEVKFHRRIPAWFHRIIQVYNLRRLSISKFCKGMDSGITLWREA